MTKPNAGARAAYPPSEPSSSDAARVASAPDTHDDKLDGLPDMHISTEVEDLGFDQKTVTGRR